MANPWAKANEMKRRAEWLSSQSFVVLSIQVPRDNEKSPQSAEQFFAALHGIYRNDPAIQEHISFEIVAQKDAITFYAFTPLHLRDFVEGQLYAQYPDLQINQVSDYTREVQLEGMHVAATNIVLTKEDVYPIKTYPDTEVDPLASITAVLSGLDEKEQIWLQIVVKPIGDEWQNKGVSYVQSIRKTGKPPGKSSGGLAPKMLRLTGRVIQEIMQPGSGVGDGPAAEPPKLSAPQEAALKGIESKITKLGYEAIFRVVAISPEMVIARARTQAVLAAFKQYNTTNLNGFQGGQIYIDDFTLWQKYINREAEEKGSVLNIEELASVYHFPSKSVETAAISYSGSKKGEAPFNLPLKDVEDPKDLTVLGKTDFRNSSKEFGIKLEDRKRHIYIIGKSGSGKSVLQENMIIDDIMEGRGVVVVDPHGELADKIVESVPEHRIQDVIVFDPADREFPVAFNLLENVGDDFKGMVASGFVGIIEKIFSHSWGPRLEYILRNTVLALLDSQNPTMLGIPRMLTDQGFRNQIVEQIKDTVVRDFWTNEFAAMDQKQRTEAIAPILNKVGQFLSTSTIRNIVGQPKSTFDIREIMDREQILIVNLSKGKIGEDNMALLGAMVITKVQLAAMSRADVSAAERPNCFLYVDEFQNFATQSFATILSEARKYGLGLTIAHQYIAQMSDEVKDAVIGNVGTLITFRIGGPDAESIVGEFAPVFDANDLINLQKYHIYIKLLVDGMAAPAFSAQTLPPKHIERSFRDEVIAHSRSKYSRPRAVVEDEIEEIGGYKAKREAENAAKAAQAILNQGQSIAIRPPGMQGAGQPMVAQPAALPVQPVKVTPPPAQAMQSSVPQPLASSPPIRVTPPQRVGEATPSPSTVSTPVAHPVPAVMHPSPAPMVFEPVQQVENYVPAPVPLVAPLLVEQGGEGMEMAPKPPKKEKPLKVLDGWVYKEVAQKGGLKWFFGEPEKEVLAKLEAKRIQKEQAQKLAADSPMLQPPIEQNTNTSSYEEAYSDYDDGYKEE